MKKHFDKLGDRVLSLLGLDFEMDLSDDFISRIRPDLYLGSRPFPDKVDLLKQAGITHIVSCLDLEKRQELRFLEPDFHTLFLPLRDGLDEDIASAFPRLFEFQADSASEPNAKTLVHCEVGVSRSATLVLALLMQGGYHSFYDAYLELRSKRGKVLPNIGFASQLQQLEHRTGQHAASPGEPSSLARYLKQVCHAPVELDVLQSALEQHNYNALSAIQAIFGEEIPRVIQGVR